MSGFQRYFEKPTMPMFISNWLFGMGVIEYPIGTEHRVISFFYAAIILMIYCSLCAYIYPYIIQLTEELETNQTIIKVIFYTHIYITLVTVILGWQRDKGMHLIINQLTFADTLLEKIGIPKNYLKLLKGQIGRYIGLVIVTIGMFVANMFITFAHESIKGQQFIATLVIHYPIIILFVVDCAFMNILAYVRYRFRQLNNELKRKLTSTINYPQHTRLVNQYLNKNEASKRVIVDHIIDIDATFLINTAKQAHLELTKACQLTDDTFSMHIVLTIAVAITFITGSVYHIYLLLLDKNISDYKFYRFLIADSTFCLYYLIKMYVFSYTGSGISEEAQKTGDFISQIYDEPYSNKETQKEIRYFHVQLINSAIELGSYGYFRINFTLIQTVTSSVTTYLMIMGQFGNFIVPNCSNSTCS